MLEVSIGCMLAVSMPDRMLAVSVPDRMVEVSVPCRALELSTPGLIVSPFEVTGCP
jgi:hypothetical protein